MCGAKLEVCTHYPELYQHLGVQIAPWSRDGIHYTCHYTHKIKDQGTTQWGDCCRLVGVSDVELKIDWTPKNNELIQSIKDKAAGRPVLFVNGARAPFTRTDGYGMEMVPNPYVYGRALRKLREQFFAVYVGKGDRLYPVDVDLDLHGKTTVTELLDIASISSAFFGQCSFVIPLAESFDRPMLAMWAHRGLTSKDEYLTYITPAKVLAKPSSRYVVDNWSTEQINDVIRQVCDAGTGSRAVQG